MKDSELTEAPEGAAAPAEWNWKENDILLDTFRIVEIPEAQLWKVYIVEDQESLRRHVIKTLPEDLAWEKADFDRFVQESTQWAELGMHPHLVTVDFLLSIQKRPCLFLEYIEGEDLSRLIGTPRLEPGGVIVMAIQFCSGMEHAWSKKSIVHKDIKPGNILVSGDGSVKITDFGLIKVFDSIEIPDRFRYEKDIASYAYRLTKTGGGLGVPLYLSPEQESNKSISSLTSDIFSFGIVLYEMLAAQGPTHSREWNEQMTALKDSVKKGNPASLPALARIPEALRAVIEKCLEVNPEKRYGDFKELQQHLMDIHQRILEKPYEMVQQEHSEEESLIREGMSRYFGGRYDEAIRCYNKAQELNPDNSYLWIQKGRALKARGSLDEASKYLNKALLKDQNNIQLWFNLCDVFSRLGKYSLALKCFDRILQMRPDDVDTLVRKGHSLITLGMNNEAIACFSRVLEIDPKSPAACKGKGIACLNLHMYTDALEVFRNAVTFASQDSEAWYNLGMAQIQLSKFTDALASLETSLTLKDDFAGAWLKKGQTLSRLSRPSEALNSFNRALVSNPRFAEAWNSKGETLVILKRTNDAIDCFSKALDINPRYAEAWNNKGMALGNRGSYGEAVECFSRALSINPSLDKAVKGVQQFSGY